MTEEEFINQLGHWGEYPKYPVADWKAEVENNDTRLGYWAWVAAQLEFEEDYNAGGPNEEQ